MSGKVKDNVEGKTGSDSMATAKLDSAFTVEHNREQNMDDLPELQSEVVGVKTRQKGSTRRQPLETKSHWESLVGAADTFNQDTRKMFRYVKKKLRSKRRNGETEVKSIHIVQEEDESKWARRSASSAASRTSTDTACSNSSREETNLEVVHDLAEENIKRKKGPPAMKHQNSQRLRY